MGTSKYLITVSMDFYIEAPTLTDEEFENGDFDKVYDVFWEQYKNDTLPKGDAFEIGSIMLV